MRRKPATALEATPPHETSDVREAVTLVLAIARDLGVRLAPGSAILDFGCGRGQSVAELLAQGYAAEGVDITPSWRTASPPETDPALLTRLHLAEANPFQLPFPDSSFDLAFSNQVFEHVQDYTQAFRELGRVLKPGAISVHIFPSRWRPIENHVKVPLATVLRSRAWLSLWALLGVRNEYQGGFPWRQVVDLNASFLRDHTAYPTARAMRRMGREAGVQVTFTPELYVAHHPGRLGRLVRAWQRPFPRWVGRLGARAFSTMTQWAMVVSAPSSPGT